MSASRVTTLSSRRGSFIYQKFQDLIQTFGSSWMTDADRTVFSSWVPTELNATSKISPFHPSIQKVYRNPELMDGLYLPFPSLYTNGCTLAIVFSEYRWDAMTYDIDDESDSRFFDPFAGAVVRPSFDTAVDELKESKEWRENPYFNFLRVALGHYAIQEKLHFRIEDEQSIVLFDRLGMSGIEICQL